MPKRLLLLAVWLGLTIFSFGLPLQAQVDPAFLPAHDAHQGVTVAARPMLAEAAYKTQFGSRTPYEAGILALEVFFRNDNDRSIRLNLETIRLLVSRPGQPLQRIEPLSPEEVADRVLLNAPSDPRRRRFPVPVGGRTGDSDRDKNWQEFVARLRAAGMKSNILGSKTTLSGFLYFDMDRHYDWLADARLDVPDLAFVPGNEALFFFQVDLAPSVR
jgi:hypothetical protein